MPTDANIPLSGRPVQIENPLQAYGQVLSLKNAMQQGQLQQQQIQAATLGNQQKQRALDEETALANTLSKNTTTNPDGTVTTNHGGVMQDLTSKGMANAALKYDADRRANEKNQIDNEKGRLANIKSQNEAVGQLLGPIVNAPPGTPPEQLQAMYTAARAQGIQQKTIQPQDAPEVYDPGFVSGHYQASMDSAKQAEQHQRDLDYAQKVVEFKQKKATEDPDISKKWQEHASTILGSAANDAQYQFGLQALKKQGAPDDILDQFDKQYSGAAVLRAQQLGINSEQKITNQGAADTRAEAAKRDASTAAYQKGELSLGAGRLAVSRQEANLRQKTFDATLGAGLDPDGHPIIGPDGKPVASPQAQMAVEGKMSPQTMRSLIRKSPALIGQIRALDPNFDEADIEKRYSTLKEFNSTNVGKAGGQALALNTLIHHADLYMQTAEALHNGTFTPGNALYNKVAATFGSAPPTSAALVARFFAGETGKVATGGVPAEGEINGILKNLSSSNSTEQIAGAGKTLLQIAAGRATPLMERVNDAKLQNVVHVLGPDAKEILSRRGFDPNTMKATGGGSGGVSVTDPNGKVHTFPDQKSADNFKQAAGIK